MQRHFKDWVLNACDEVCGKKRWRRDKGDTRWSNKEVKKAVSRKKDAHKAICLHCNEENKRRYKSMKNQARKVVSKAIR